MKHGSRLAVVVVVAAAAAEGVVKIPSMSHYAWQSV